METIRSKIQAASGSSVPFDTPVEFANEIARPASKAMDAFNSNMLKTFTSCQNEWLGFVGRRMQENLSMPARLASCRSMPDVQQVYMDYWNRTIDQYQDEFQTLVRTLQQSDGKRAADIAIPTETNGIKPH